MSEALTSGACCCTEAHRFAAALLLLVQRDPAMRSAVAQVVWDAAADALGATPESVENVVRLLRAELAPAEAWMARAVLAGAPEGDDEREG